MNFNCQSQPFSISLCNFYADVTDDVLASLTAVLLVDAVQTVDDAVTRVVVVQTHRAVDGDALEMLLVTLRAARAVTHQLTALADAAYITQSSRDISTSILHGQVK